MAPILRIYCAEHNRESTARETERLLRVRFIPVWSERDIRSIGRDEVARVLDAIVQRGNPSAANHALAAVRKFFNWCIERGIVETSPCNNISRPGAVVARERVLDDAELAAVWSVTATLGYPYGTIVQLLILTAQRRGEVTGMRWSELDLAKALWTMPGARTKNKRRHVVPLSPLSICILDALPRLHDDLVFPARGRETTNFSGFSKLKRQIDVATGVDDWTLHDLRRTAATGMAGLGVAPHVVERLLNHVSGTFGGVAGIYNRFEYLDPMRSAAEAWSHHVQALGMAERDTVA